MSGEEKQGVTIDHRPGFVLVHFAGYPPMVMPYQAAAAIALDIMEHAKAAQGSELRPRILVAH